MDHFVYAVMNPVIYLRFHKSLKNIHHFSLLIHLDCTDLNDLKRQTAVGIFFSSGTLVPLKVKNNIVHTVVPSFYFQCINSFFSLLSSITDRFVSFNKTAHTCGQKKTDTISRYRSFLLINFILRKYEIPQSTD